MILEFDFEQIKLEAIPKSIKYIISHLLTHHHDRCVLEVKLL